MRYDARQGGYAADECAELMIAADQPDADRQFRVKPLLCSPAGWNSFLAAPSPVADIRNRFSTSVLPGAARAWRRSCYLRAASCASRFDTLLFVLELAAQVNSLRLDALEPAGRHSDEHAGERRANEEISSTKKARLASGQRPTSRESSTVGDEIHFAATFLTVV